jgi:hypothetical protein
MVKKSAWSSRKCPDLDQPLVGASRGWAAMLLCAVLGACGILPTDEADGPRGTVTLSASPPSLIVFIGGSATTTVTATRTGYDLPLALSVSGLQTGVTATFNPPTLSGGALSSVLTVSAASDLGPGGGALNVLAFGPDSLDAHVSIPFMIGRPQVRIVRAGTGTGTVTSSPAGVNCGTVCNFVFPYGTSVTLTATAAAGSVFAGWSGAPCSGTNATCSLAVTAAPLITATFNTTAQSFALAVAPPTVSVPQGGSATATANITRINEFPGAVTLTASGAPSGLAVTANPASVTGNTATLEVTAAASVAAGNYPVTITGAGAGAPSQTTTLHVQVTPAAGGSGNVSFNFPLCDPSEAPVWFGVQQGTGAWTRVLPGPNGTFSFSLGASAVAGIAVVRPAGAGFNTSVIFGSREDVTSLALGDLCGGLHESTGRTQLTGTMTGIATTAAVVAVGGASTELPIPQGLNFTLDGVSAGRRDLIAAATNVNAATGSKTIPRLILRRDVAYASSIPLLNLSGPEAVMPVGRPIVVNNLGGDQASSTVSLVTTNGATGPYLRDAPINANGSVPFIGVPDSLLRPEDLHAIGVEAAPATGPSFRLAFLIHHSAVADTVALGPALSQPTVTTPGTGPLLRPRAQLASQAAYPAGASAGFEQGANSVDVTATAAYTGGTPTTWTLEVPDLASAGYDQAWGLRPGLPLDWSVIAVGGSIRPLLGATPVDGERTLAAGVGSSGSSGANQRLRVNPW